MAAVVIIVLAIVIIMTAALCISRKHKTKSKQRYNCMQIHCNYSLLFICRDYKKHNTHTYETYFTPCIAAISISGQFLISVSETPLRRDISQRKISLMNKLPNDLLLSPEVLEVSTIIGQGEAISHVLIDSDIHQ